MNQKVNQTEADRRRKMAEEMESRGLTLNGQPACIRGVLCKFATVGQLDGPLMGEWAWPTLFKMNEGEANTLSM